MNNFKHFVPAALQEKIKSLAELSIDYVNDIGENVISCEEISHIEGNYRSGWLPRQDGGFSADTFIALGYGNHLCKSEKEFTDKQYLDCMHQFCQENDIDESLELSDDGQEKFYDYQDGWNQGNESLIQFQCFVDNSCIRNRERQDTVTCRLSINFKDAPYYREKYATCLWQVVYTTDEFMALDNLVIIDSVTIDREK